MFTLRKQLLHKGKHTVLALAIVVLTKYLILITQNSIDIVNVTP